MIPELVWGLRQEELLDNEGAEKGVKKLGWLNNTTRLKIRELKKVQKSQDRKL